MSKEAMKLAFEAVDKAYDKLARAIRDKTSPDDAYIEIDMAHHYLKQALANQEQGEDLAFKADYWKRMHDEVRAELIKATSSKQEQGEPVEWGVDWGKDGNSVSIIKRLADGNIEVLAWEYAPHPQQRTWVELTDRQKLVLIKHAPDWTALQLIEEVETMLRINNA